MTGSGRSTVLGATVARLLPVGANRVGAGSDAPWVALLPDVVMTEAWVVGRPTASEIAGLARIADRVCLLGERGHAVGLDATLQRDLEERGVDRSRITGPDRRLVERPGLLWFRRDARRDRGALTALAKPTVEAGGTVLAEWRNPTRDLAWQRLRVGPLLGTIRIAWPADDPVATQIAGRRHIEESFARRWMARRGIPRPRPILRPILEVERTLAKRAGRGAIMAAANLDASRPPAWLREIAAKSDVSLDDHAWVLAAPGDYATQKILFVLEPRNELDEAGQRAPASGRGGEQDLPPIPGRSGLFAKIAIDPIAGPRLEAAASALDRLSAVSVARGRVPTVSFTGRAGALSVLAEHAIDGVPFERLAPDRARAAAERFVEWLSQLASETKQPMNIDELRASLDRIVSAYVAAYAPPAAERRAIATRVATIVAADPPLRSVFVHGDPGVQNLVVSGTADVGVLDWENGDPAGLPLWDLLVFLRSYAVWTTAGRGRESRFSAARRHLIDGSEMTSRLAESIVSHRQRLGIPREVVEPLVTLGFVWLAAKDAARLRPAAAASGQAVRLARMFLDRGPDCAILRAVEREP